jgi:acetyltransferase-like isoleucine patch superfamily enzyme
VLFFFTGRPGHSRLERRRANGERRTMQAAGRYALPSSLADFAAHWPADAPPWTWLPAIGAALAAAPLPDAPRDLPPGVHVSGRVFLHPSVKLPHVCTLLGPAWIGPDTEIRPGAFLRGNVIVGAGCVLGNACEFKNALLMDRVQVPHFSYVGDSVLGNRTHLGAGVICSNLRSDRQPVRVRLPDGSTVDTGLRKFGALLGEDVEVGCNCVLQPGAILGRGAVVYPLTPFRGVLPAGHVARTSHAGIAITERRG